MELRIYPRIDMKYSTLEHNDTFYHDMQISWPDSGSPPIRLSDS